MFHWNKCITQFSDCQDAVGVKGHILKLSTSSNKWNMSFVNPVIIFLFHVTNIYVSKKQKCAFNSFNVINNFEASGDYIIPIIFMHSVVFFTYMEIKHIPLFSINIFFPSNSRKYIKELPNSISILLIIYIVVHCKLASRVFPTGVCGGRSLPPPAKNLLILLPTIPPSKHTHQIFIPPTKG